MVYREDKGFFDKVYALVRKIPAGKVTTYGEIAGMLGTKDARKVGWALHANKDEKTPCHRVVNKNGGLAPNFAFDGEEEQRRRLLAEGVSLKDKKVDLKKHLWVPQR
jgi:methylated-DNA-protein-cysteine methyltransferase-like protein